MRLWNRTALLLLATGLVTGCPGEDTPSATTPERPRVRVADVVCSTPVMVAGEKQASTSVWVNGMEVVPLDGSTTFSASVPLAEGVQSLRVWVQSATGERSEVVEVSTTLDLTPPSAPTLDMVPPVSQETSYTFMGMKPPGTSILLNGSEVVALGEETTWSTTVNLSAGPNQFRITARDRCQESEVVMVGIFQDDSGVFLTVDDPESPTCTATQELKGTRGPGVAIRLNGTEIVPAGDSTTWTYQVDLDEGTNDFRITGVSEGVESSPRDVQIVYDATPPSAPVVAEMLRQELFTCEVEFGVAGTKEANTSIWVNDVEVVAENASEMFSFMTNLSEGRNRLQVDARDFCGRTSGAPTIVTVNLDTTQPTLMVDSPRAMDTLAGIATIRGTAMDNSRVEAVIVEVDQQPLSRVTTTSTFAVQWDTTAATEGTHLISVVAVDRAGKMSTPVTLTVNVSNAARVVSQEPAPPMGDPDQARSVRPTVSHLTTGQVGVTWHDNLDVLESGNDDDILLRVYNNGGAALPIVVVSDGAPDGRSLNPRNAAGPNGILHVVWQDDGDYDSNRRVDFDIMYRTWTNGALAPTITLVSTDPMDSGIDGRSQFPDVAVDPMGGVHVVWQDDGDLDGDGMNDTDIYYASSNGAGGFNPPILLTNMANSGQSSRPRIAITPNGCPHVVWHDDGNIAPNDTDGALDVYYLGSVPNMAGGCTWGSPVLVSEENGFMRALSPAIEADPNDMRGLLWVGFEAEGNVAMNGADFDVFMRSIFESLTGPLVLVSDHTADGVSREPAVTVDDNGSVFVMWRDDGDIASSGMDSDTFLRSWNGSALEPIASISDASMNASNTLESLSPDLATDGMRLFLVWDDRSDYDGDAVADADILFLLR
jgi:hypothetical protein